MKFIINGLIDSGSAGRFVAKVTEKVSVVFAPASLVELKPAEAGAP